MKKMIKKYIFVVVYFLLNVCTYSQILPSKSDVHIELFPFMKILFYVWIHAQDFRWDVEIYEILIGMEII